MDTQKVARLIKDLEIYNRLYAEAREKSHKYGYWLEVIANIRIQLADEGIPLEITEADKILNRHYLLAPEYREYSIGN